LRKGEFEELIMVDGDRRDGWWQHWVDERKQAEHVRVTQMNGSDRDERGSLSRGGVLKQSEDVKNKTLEMAGVVREGPSAGTLLLLRAYC
jgi:hypothetical protein